MHGTDASIVSSQHNAALFDELITRSAAVKIAASKNDGGAAGGRIDRHHHHHTFIVNKLSKRNLTCDRE